MTNIREFNLETSQLSEKCYEILSDYPSIQSKLTAAKMNPLGFLNEYHGLDDDLDGLLDELLPQASVFLTKFWESSYHEQIFFTLSKNRKRKSLTSLKIPKPFERVRTFKAGFLSICEEDTYKYYTSLFREVNGVDWFPVFICGLLIVAQDKLIKEVNEKGDPLAPYVHTVMTKVIEPLLAILDYECQVIIESDRHKRKSATKKVRGVLTKYKDLHEAFVDIYQQRTQSNMSVSLKEILRALENDNVVFQDARTGDIVIRNTDEKVTSSVLASWLTTCRSKDK